MQLCSSRTHTRLVANVHLQLKPKLENNYILLCNCFHPLLCFRILPNNCELSLLDFSFFTQYWSLTSKKVGYRVCNSIHVHCTVTQWVRSSLLCTMSLFFQRNIKFVRCLNAMNNKRGASLFQRSFYPFHKIAVAATSFYNDSLLLYTITATSLCNYSYFVTEVQLIHYT